jgi:hypothetical protein
MKARMLLSADVRLNAASQVQAYVPHLEGGQAQTGEPAAARSLRCAYDGSSRTHLTIQRVAERQAYAR